MMQPDSLAFLNVHLPPGSLPWPILAILLVGMFVTLGMVIRKASGLKLYLKEFPTHQATVIGGLLVFTGASLVAISRMALGLAFPDGYGEYLLLLGGVITGVALWGVGNRATSVELAQAKSAGEIAKAGAAPAGPAVTVEGNAQINAAPPVIPDRRPSPFGGSSQ